MSRGLGHIDRVLSPGSVPHEVVEEQLRQADFPPHEIDRLIGMSASARTDAIESYNTTGLTGDEPSEWLEDQAISVT